MNKKIFVLFTLFAVLSLALCACVGKSASSGPAMTEQAAPVKQDTAQATPRPSESIPKDTAQVPTSEPTPEPTPKVDVEWQTMAYQYEDSSGYTFEITIKVSPWINTKNEEYVAAAWDEVSRGRSLPYFNPNERAYHNGRYTFLSVSSLTDMYYCIGEISVKNTTAGWDITQESPISLKEIYISPIQTNEEVARSIKEGHTTGQIVYSDKTSSDYVWLNITPQLKSNNWGPVPFIFAHYDRKTPKCPDGEYISEISGTAFCVSTSSHARSDSMLLKLSIIEKDD